MDYPSKFESLPPRQDGKAVLWVVVAALALSAGLFASTQFVPPGSECGVSATDEAAETERLALVQESLKTSLVLPLDFKTVSDFDLLDKNNQSVSQTVFDDTWSLVFFGYTHCPDVCPITLQVLKTAVAQLAEQNQPIPQIVFVSVDPVRDTSDVMKQYIGYFNDEFVGITGELNKVHELTRSLGIVATFTANDADPDNYIVDHTASLLLIDPQRRLRAKVTPPHEADNIVADFLTLIAAPS